jgi:hypothetical protein
MEAAYGPTLLDNGPWLAAQALDSVHTPRPRGRWCSS